MTALLAFALLVRQDSPSALLARMQDAVKAGDKAAITALFDNQGESDYLFRMASRCGGLNNLKVAVFRSPKGWESTGKYWATFHAWQELEQDHDPIYRVQETASGLKLGPEIPESDCGGKVTSATVDVAIERDAGAVWVTSQLGFADAVPGRALLFRLNDNYSLTKGPGERYRATTLDESEVSSASLPDFRVGSLLALTATDRIGRVSCSYTAKLGTGARHSDDRDQVTSTYAYITSWWIPSLGRLPYTTSVKVAAPAGWIVRSEGRLEPFKATPKHSTLAMFKCDVPISYPKVIAGKYVLAAEGTANGKRLRSYQFAPVDKKRAEQDVETMKKAMVFYEANLGPWPFKGYECLDGKNYYGIESYSYTLLAPSITSWAVSHEMGHTYFGGVVPCPYVKDSWNEGLTEYVDSVLFLKDPKIPARGLDTMKFPMPLTEMPIPWEYEGATYYRGAYVMQMLDAEIGHDAVMQALRALIKDRVGKDTTWRDLRPYFEKSSGGDLAWFWKQWIEGGQFPHVSILSATTRSENGKWVTKVAIKQSGTDAPFRLRFAVRLKGTGEVEFPSQMTGPTETYEVTSDFKPDEVSVNPIPSALVKVDGPIKVSDTPSLAAMAFAS
ncbi:MAG: hypothetical protein QOJ65_460 [Fimbriimonadaceae bacterium]|jgi:hypothetical protein|nr:hypothetical protein [Fimbriimonadaceae bacterium]